MADDTYRTAVAFAELRYLPGREVNQNAFVSCAMNTILHAPDLDYASKALAYYKNCITDWSKIEKAYKKKPQDLISAMSRVQVMIPQLPDSATYGTYYLYYTLGSSDLKIPSFCRHIQTAAGAVSSSVPSLNAESVPAGTLTAEKLTFYVDSTQTFSGYKNVYTVFKNGNYNGAFNDTLAYMSIKDRNDRMFCTIGKERGTGILAVNDSILPYSVRCYGSTYAVFNRAYINSLPFWTDPDPAEMVAAMTFDSSVAKLQIFRPCDLEFLLLATFAGLNLL